MYGSYKWGRPEIKTEEEGGDRALTTEGDGMDRYKKRSSAVILVIRNDNDISFEC